MHHVSFMRSLCAAIALTVWAGAAYAQNAPVAETALPYMLPRPGIKLSRVPRIAGEVVVCLEGQPWPLFGAGIPLALYDADRKLVAVIKAGDQGQFHFEASAPGRYTLLVGAGELESLSIPVLLLTPDQQKEKAETGLMISLRMRSDRIKSSIAVIKNMRLRSELLEWVAQDQEVRNAWIKQGADEKNSAMKGRMAAMDRENLARVRQVVRSYGLPGPELVGIDGVEAILLLIQHAEHGFQQEMLPRVQKAYRHRKVSGNYYALLVDRVRVVDGKPQIYGTQTRPLEDWKGHEPVLFPIEDAVHVDRRRAEVGLMPLNDYLKGLREMYFPSEKPKS